MPTYKVVLFADESQPTQVQYMKNQRKAIEEAIPDLVVEEANKMILDLRDTLSSPVQTVYPLC